MNRVVLCLVPRFAHDKLRADADTVSVTAAVSEAIQNALLLPEPGQQAGDWWHRRMLMAVSVPCKVYAEINNLALEHFDGDDRDAAGWLIARGLGWILPLPAPHELRRVVAAPQGKPSESEPPAVTMYRFEPRGLYALRKSREPLPPDDSAPSGEELAKRRALLGISQRRLAEKAGLLRGLVAEVERGRRRHVLTRLRMSMALSELEQEQGHE